MRNSSAASRILSAVLLLTVILPCTVRAEDSITSNIKNAWGELTQTSKPIFDPAQYDATHPKPADPKKLDPFPAKLQKERDKYFKKDSERKRKFFRNLREKNLTPQEEREAIAAFNKKEIDRQQKFLNKQRKKMEKHAAKAN